MEVVIAAPTELFEDVEQHAKVAVGSIDDRYLVAVYRRAGDDIKVITVYHTRNIAKLVSSKTQRGAWRSAG